MLEYILRKEKENGTLAKNGAVVKTIVTTELVRSIADDYGVKTLDVLTGFKFIGEKIKEFKQNREYSFVFGLEESYGYLKGTYARDKDAVVAAMLVCEMAADYKAMGKTLYDGLTEIYEKYGYIQSGLKTLTLKGSDGAEKIKSIMKHIRQYTPQTIAGCEVNEVKDYLKGIAKMPKSDVLKFFLDKGWFAVRPSGTEPKIKFYYEIEGDKSIDLKGIAHDFKFKFD